MNKFTDIEALNKILESDSDQGNDLDNKDFDSADKDCVLEGLDPLLHLLAGVSRSVSLVVAYIMTVTGLGWQEALAAVRVARPCAGPNLGFQRQLQEFETTHADQYREWLRQEYKESPFNDEDDIRILLTRSLKPNGVAVEVNVEPPTPPGLQGT